MGAINYQRMVLGGLAAGLVINIGEFILNVPLLGEQMQAAMADIGVQESSSAMAVYVTYGFLLGIAALWLYTAIRPRMGAGPKTALCAGLYVWAVVWGTFVAMNLAVPIYPMSFTWIGAVWGLVEMPLATVVGAALYKEEAA